MISLSENKEYTFKREPSEPFNNLIYTVCIFPILCHIRDFTANSIYVRLYGLFIAGTFIVLILNQLYIIITKRYKLSDLIIDNNHITIKKWFLMRYYTIDLQQIKNITELLLTLDNLIEITLMNNKKIRLSLKGYSNNDKKLVSNQFKVINSNLKIQLN
ncbi:hypothetical protein LL033_24790 (plasmid) [Clostridium estertheticum]|uniref:hypothetical protein n=1 Tax=Clostridium estertheticum TaxID=238834 RepID=UPI001C0E7927|nr:hypothetical protein [Clostridium estertheticum]MBU3217827.1 hypothetical protein [Clostridium estertheticum]WAG58343.1 hypothetical protein LL033_24790 [Clostridium estertheticum]